MYEVTRPSIKLAKGNPTVPPLIADAGIREIRIGGLVGPDGEIPGGSGKGVIVEALDASLAAELVRVVALHPGEAGIEGWLFLDSPDLASGRTHRVHAALAVRAQHPLEDREASALRGTDRSTGDTQHALKVEIRGGALSLKSLLA